MIQESCIIKTIRVTKRGQIIHFQVKLPETAKRIIGIELGGFQLNESDHDIGHEIYGGGIKEPKGREVHAEASGHSLMPFKRNKLIGELRLQSCEEANIFYTGHIQADSNLGYLDFTKGFFTPNFYTHQTKALEERVVVDAETTTVLGIYVDRTETKGIKIAIVNYQINLYIWYQS